jgi:hypothetical protein
MTIDVAFMTRFIWKDVLWIDCLHRFSASGDDYQNIASYFNVLHLLQMTSDVAYVTSMVRKDVLRTDRHHKFYAGSDDNQNIASLFNILTT